ncbi:MAG: class I SAM-dependent methyltransferase [candidate division WOR-3 bacterium]|nr:class I SAM-dependent methyltransferase [candidate division WOR-3 bacterium]
MNNRKRIHRHFSDIAEIYRNIRKTDNRPIFVIKRELQRLPVIHGADIGCGAGRYDRELFLNLGDRLFLFAIDENEKMLTYLRRYLSMFNITQFKAIRAIGSSIPLYANSVNCVFTFNAVHHFNLPMFLKESVRILKKDGYLFVYTRLHSQNKRNIWGRYFPGFYEKEKRLYRLKEMESAISQVSCLQLQSIEYFKFRRLSSLHFLKEQARKRHYSTFCYYEKEEFKNALQDFEKNIRENFPDPQKVIWIDENIMFLIRKINLVES